MYDDLYEVATKNAVVHDLEVRKELIRALHYPFVNSTELRTDGQLKAITFILKMFEEGKKAVLLQAAVGIGKSLINMTVALNMSEKAFICMPQKSLQEQYIGDFPNWCTEIRGRNNYDCQRCNNPCSEGICRTEGKYKCENFGLCEYWKQKVAASEAKVCIMNFAYFVLERSNLFEHRELLVIDEGDDIAESSVLGMMSVTLSRRTLRGLYDQVDWNMSDGKILEHVRGLLDYEIGFLEDLELYSVSQVKLLEAYKDLFRRVERVENGWVAQRSKFFSKGRWGIKAGVYQSLVFKPLSIAPFAERLVWSRADKIVVSSATILDRNSYIVETGLDFLDDDEIVYVAMDSPFDAKRRPVFYLGDRVGKMTAKLMSQNLPKAVDEIVRIAKEHEGMRGLIHCTSFKNGISLSNMLRGSEIADRMIYHTSEIDRNELIRMMMNEETPEDSIVVSPSLTRGADLKGNRLRFGILMKVPYPNTMDARIRIRSKDFRWYSLIALREVCQSVGRGMRSSDDWCDTYVLDAGFKGLMNGIVKKRVPNWLSEAVIWK